MMPPQIWFKGQYAGLCPIWIADPLGDCFVHPRGVLGWLTFHFTEPMVQTINFLGSMVSTEFEPHFPFQYDDSVGYHFRDVFGGE